jgi:nucleoside-diphosphate-sugar epimerase
MIGGTGFIGSRVAARLAADHDVTILHRGKRNPALPDSVRLLTGDRNRLAEHAAEFRACAPDVVLDMISGDEHQARAVVDAFRGVAHRLVTASSMDVYSVYDSLLGRAAGPVDSTPLKEDSPLRTTRYPARNTALSAIFDWVTPDYEKILVEEAVRAEPALPGTIVRLPMVYGPGDPLHRFMAFVKRIDNGRAVIPLDEDWAAWRGPMGYVEDVAAAIALAVTNPAAAGRTYHVAEPEALTWAEWARAIGDVVGWHGRVATVPRDQTPKHLKPPFNTAQPWIVDSSRIRRELGYRETVPRAEALMQTVAWERSSPAPFDAASFDYAVEDAL